MPLTVSDTCIKCIYVDEYSIIDRFYGSRLFVWGDNGSGQLGIDSRTGVNAATPVETVSRGSTWKDVNVHFDTGTTILALKTDGTLWTWGSNSRGQLGDNSTIDRSSPGQTIAGGTNWRSIGGHNLAVFGIKTDGTLWGWGAGGRVGDGTNIQRSSPVQITGTNWKTVTSSEAVSIAIKTDGTLWTWGCNLFGGTGTNSFWNTAPLAPVQVGANTDWAQAGTATRHHMALKCDGTLFGWGLNAGGQLGDNSIVNRSSPVQVLGAGKWKCIKSPIGNYNTFAVKADGTVWSWGCNSDNGQNFLGHNDAIGKSSPVQIVAGGTNWKMVMGGYRKYRGLKLDGSFWNMNNNGVTNVTPGCFTTIASPQGFGNSFAAISVE